jgi:hypothetical protein
MRAHLEKLRTYAAVRSDPTLRQTWTNGSCSQTWPNT